MIYNDGGTRFSVEPVHKLFSALEWWQSLPHKVIKNMYIYMTTKHALTRFSHIQCMIHEERGVNAP